MVCSWAIWGRSGVIWDAAVQCVKTRLNLVSKITSEYSVHLCKLGWNKIGAKFKSHVTLLLSKPWKESFCEVPSILSEQNAQPSNEFEFHLRQNRHECHPVQDVTHPTSSSGSHFLNSDGTFSRTSKSSHLSSLW